MPRVNSLIKGKTILITGGTGSFGNSVVGRLLELRPKSVIVFSRDEKKQYDMRNKFNSKLIKFVIGDVRERNRVDEVVGGNIDYIFHAAALKQVPTCEFFPMEAIKTNVLGAENIIRSAIENKVKRLVILSTDKAVYPINAMGMSKALMEKVMIASSKNLSTSTPHTILSGVRYGNVLYSRGSVIPYFINQIKLNKKLTVTNGQMTRFLLPLENAIDLILYALVNGKNGHMYIRKAPACTIETLAKALCEIFEHDKGYEELGLRAGEKMHESLVSDEEMFRAIDRGNYFEIPPESHELNYDKYFSSGNKNKTNKLKQYNSFNTVQLDLSQTKKLLLSLPEIKAEYKNFKKNDRTTFETSTYSVL